MLLYSTNHFCQNYQLHLLLSKLFDICPSPARHNFVPKCKSWIHKRFNLYIITEANEAHPQIRVVFRRGKSTVNLLQSDRLSHCVKEMWCHLTMRN